MESWQVLFLSAVIFTTGGLIGPSNRGTVVSGGLGVLAMLFAAALKFG